MGEAGGLGKGGSLHRERLASWEQMENVALTPKVSGLSLILLLRQGKGRGTKETPEVVENSRGTSWEKNGKKKKGSAVSPSPPKSACSRRASDSK